LKPFEASALATVNNKTLQNWQASGGFVQTLLQQAWSSARDYKFLRGTGAGSPLGILKAPGRITLKRKTAGTVTYEDAAKMTGRLLPDALGNAIWVASITLKPTLMLLVDGAGRLIFVNGDATKGIPDTLAGIPIKWTGKTPTVGNEGDLMLVDFRYYLIKPGSGPFVAISEHAKFTANKTVFRIVANIDGQPWVKDPLLLEDGATTVSPYVILQ
jgi:HK97 family phage major capsid protein